MWKYFSQHISIAKLGYRTLRYQDTSVSNYFGTSAELSRDTGSGQRHFGTDAELVRTLRTQY